MRRGGDGGQSEGSSNDPEYCQAHTVVRDVAAWKDGSFCFYQGCHRLPRGCQDVHRRRDDKGREDDRDGRGFSPGPCVDGRQHGYRSSVDGQGCHTTGEERYEPEGDNSLPGIQRRGYLRERCVVQCREDRSQAARDKR